MSTYKTNGETYQGYANWATWNLCLWFDNEEGLYESYRSNSGNWNAESAKDHALSIMPKGTPDFEGDELELVDWSEVAEVWNQD